MINNKIKNSRIIQSCFLSILILGIAGSINAQQAVDNCKRCEATNNFSKSEIINVSSKELTSRLVFINELYAPPTAASIKIENRTIIIDVLIDKQGAVIEAVASKGHPALTSVGTVIAYRAKFKPLEIDDKPMYMCGKLVLKWDPDKLDKSTGNIKNTDYFRPKNHP